MKGPLFYSKILLFGEYGIIKNSKGLSIPYNFFKGALKFENHLSETSQASHRALCEFASYLETLSSDLVEFDHPRFKEDLNKGMYFDSTIPQGYGVGSSGALVAAVYDRYAANKITVLENLTREKLLKLKTIFAAMESFFHGKSSGLDPLNSYLSLPILIHSQNEIEPTGIPSQAAGKGAVFLLDSGQVGETAPMVSLFMKQMQNRKFQKVMKEEFVAYTDACVDHFLKGNVGALLKDIKKLSGVVLKHFKPMIPVTFHQLWQNGIETNAYYLKLCGSGGGGYFLGFTEDLEKARQALKGHTLEVVYTF